MKSAVKMLGTSVAIQLGFRLLMCFYPLDLPIEHTSRLMRILGTVVVTIELPAIVGEELLLPRASQLARETVAFVFGAGTLMMLLLVMRTLVRMARPGH